jgi:hypothetical protein
LRNIHQREGNRGDFRPGSISQELTTVSFIRIRQLDERVATSGLFMGGGKERRKLEPGEIVEVPDDMNLPDGENLMQALWDGGMIDILPDTAVPTRPLDYENRREAKLCSPTCKTNGPDEIADRDKALARVEARLFNDTSASLPFDGGSPEEDVPDEVVTAPLPAPVKTPGGRVRRRGAPQAAQHGAEATT